MLKICRLRSVIRLNKRLLVSLSSIEEDVKKPPSNFMLPAYQHPFEYARDYEVERASLKLTAPKHFNFARDVIDRWEALEKLDGKTRMALWWVDDLGNERRISYGELAAESRRVANALEQVAGLKPGDRVIVVLPKLWQWYVTILACCRAGLVVSPGTSMLSARDIEHRLVKSNAKAVIGDEISAAKFDEALTNVNPEQVKAKILVGSTPDKSQRAGWLEWHRDLLSHKDLTTDHQCHDTKAEDEMLVYFTSGTVGMPKMVNIPHYMALGHYTSSRYWYCYRPGSLGYVVTDPGWAKSLYAVYSAWLCQACLFVKHNTEPVKNVGLEGLQILKKYPIETFCAAPTVPQPQEIPHLRYCLSGGEPNNPEVIEQWKKLTGTQFREGYGQTETALVCCNMPGMPYKPGSMGKSLPGVDIVIVDNDCQEVSPGNEGHLAIRLGKKRCISLFKEYIGAPEATAKAFPENGKFYLTGDKAFMDEDGYIFFVGRADDVILTAGYRIGPFEVESALIEHPAVAESAVVASPDDVKGEVVKAFVVLRPEVKNTDADKLKSELQAHCKKVTAPYKYPRRIEFVDALPKTVSGKIRRVELRQKEWAGHEHGVQHHNY